MTGAPVMGIWVTWRAGGSWARFRAAPAGGVYYEGFTDTQSYAVHVGCGGTPSQWSAEARSEKYTVDYLTLVCDDTPASVSTPSRFGRCVPTTPAAVGAISTASPPAPTP